MTRDVSAKAAAHILQEYNESNPTNCMEEARENPTQ